MKIPALFLLLIGSFPVHAQLVEDAAKSCSACDGWNQPQQPFRVYGNTWYVGTQGLAAILVVTDDGLVLIDGALPQSAHLVADNIRAAGVDLVEIKYILNSHAHFDHAGGIAALQRHTGAKVLASESSFAALLSGELAVDDPQFAFGVEANRFPPVPNLSQVGDGQAIVLGDTTFTAHYTPGHTPGGTTWTWQSCDKEVCLNVVYADSLSPVSAEGYLFSDPGLSPNGAEQIQSSAALIRELPCDILLAPHPFLFGLKDKYAVLEAGLVTGNEANPFIEAGACDTYARYFEDWLEKRLTEEGSTSRDR